MALPFGDATFDLVTTGYGIRNVPMIDQAFARLVAAGAGLDADEVQAATVTHPQAVVQRALARLQA